MPFEFTRLFRRARQTALNPLATLALLVLLAVACAWAAPPPLKIGVGRIIPVAYLNDRGEAVGFAVDVMNEAARREHISVTWVPLMDGVAEGLQSRTIDLLSAGMATSERKQQFYVSEPWWFDELSVLTRAGSKQPVERLGIEPVYVEFARPYLAPATFVVEPPESGTAAAAREAKAVCRGTLDGSIITHGELHDLFLNRPNECNGVRLQSVDTAIKYGLSIISRRQDQAIAIRLRKRIDDLISDGTLLRLAAAHPPIPISGAVHLGERIRQRFRKRIWITAGCAAAIAVVFLVWFLWHRHRDLLRDKQSEARIRDITEQEEAHERLRQAQALERIGLLAAGVAHDFNNLLTVIMGSADCALHRHPHSEELQQILTSSKRAAHLTRQLLAYAGKGQFIATTFDLTDLVSRAADALKAAIPEGVGLAFNLSCEDMEIKADPHQIEQILINLVINAGEAIPPQTGGCVEIATTSCDIAPDIIRQHAHLFDTQPGRFVCLEIMDNGTGMDEATLSQVFDPFFSTKFQGRGLGLAAVYGIVRSCKGFIDVHSTPGIGSTFRVFLPAARTQRKAEIAQACGST